MIKRALLTALTAISAIYAAWDGNAATKAPAQATLEADSGYQLTTDLAYEITTPEELAWFANQVNASDGTTSFNAILKNDLVFGNDTNSVSTHYWTSIGKDSLCRFNGIFDGAGHTIYGLNMMAENDSLAGLFGFADGAIIKNLNIANFSLNYGVTGTDSIFKVDAGTIAGIFKGSMKNVHSRGSQIKIEESGLYAKSEVYLGGLIGNGKDFSVDSCTNFSTIEGSFFSEIHIGGISGRANEASIKNCINNGDIIVKNINSKNYGDYSYIGGISGVWGNISNCKNTGNLSIDAGSAGGIAGERADIYYSENTGSVSSGNRYSGGIGAYHVYVKGCKNTGNITGSFAGGIAGKSSNISYSTNSGSVNGFKIAGGINGQSTTISTCINEGDVTSDSLAGGIAGESQTIELAINKGSVKGTLAGGLCGKNEGTVWKSISYAPNVEGTSLSAGLVAINTGKLGGAYYDSTLVKNVEIIGLDSAKIDSSYVTSGLSTQEMQDINFVNTLNRVATVLTYHWSSANIPGDTHDWSYNGGYPILADSTHMYPHEITFDDGTNINIVYTDFEGHLLNIEPAVSKEGHYFVNWADSNGTVINKSTIFTEDATLFAKFSDEIVDSNLIVYANEEAAPSTPWNGSFSWPTHMIRIDTTIYTEIRTAEEFVCYLLTGFDYAILGNDIIMGLDTNSVMKNHLIPANLHNGQIFNGANHTIYGLNTYPFNLIYEGATVQNIRFVNSEIHSSIVAYSNNGLVQNISIDRIKYNGELGQVGLCVLDNSGTIDHCDNYSDISATTSQHFAGLVSSNSGTLSNSTNYGNILFEIGASSNIAGLVESNSGTIRNATNKGSIKVIIDNFDGGYSGTLNVAGISGSNKGTIISSRNEGSLDISGHWNFETAFIGGITAQGPYGYADSCTNTASITITPKDSIPLYSSSLSVGGITGFGSALHSQNTGDITIKDSSIKTTSWNIYTGGIAGKVGYDDEISFSKNKGTISLECINLSKKCSSLSYGGLVGISQGSVKNNVNEGTIQGFYIAGGIAGKADSLASDVNYADIVGVYSAGGLAGICNQSVTNSVNKANIILKRDSLTESPDSTFAGGICGKGPQKLEHVANEGNVTNTSTNSEAFAGGLSAEVDNTSIINAYNWGTVTSEIYAGGIFAIDDYSYSNPMQNIYNAGKIVAPNRSMSIREARCYTLENRNDSAYSVYYDSNLANDINDTICHFNSSLFLLFATPMTTEEMQSDKFVEKLNTTGGTTENSGIWTRGNGYPIFAENYIPESSSSDITASSSSSFTPESSSSIDQSSSSALPNSSNSDTTRLAIASLVNNHFLLEVDNRNVWIQNAKGPSYSLFDIQGHLIANEPIYSSRQRVMIPRPGMYIILIGNHAERFIAR